jgi:pimeloyl-ACP methyl ester carboxylesterase
MTLPLPRWCHRGPNCPGAFAGLLLISRSGSKTVGIGSADDGVPSRAARASGLTRSAPCRVTSLIDNGLASRLWVAAASGGSGVAEQMIEANGVELCTEAFGDPADPPIMLVMGIGASMLWWEEDFCRMLAGGGRFVIRYDHRDTGRSITYEPGQPEYTGADLTADAAGVLDGFGIPAAHLVGVSAGGGIAQELALDCADRVLSLTLISTSPATPGDRDLPPPTAEFGRFIATAEADWSNRESIIDYLVDYLRVLAGGERAFDETRVRELVRRDIERARDFAAVQNHDLMSHGEGSHKPLSSITAPTLVIHGTADPMFPLHHGEALAADIPGARLLPLEGAGHGVYRDDWEMMVSPILEHTAAAQRVRR